MLKNGEIEDDYIINFILFSYRHLEVDLETIWQATNADNLHLREQLLDMRIVN
jgi:hypothetical protein